MAMAPFESRSVGLPERPLVPPGWVKFDYQNPAETFLSAYFAATQVNAKRQQLEARMAQLGLENQRISMQRDLGEQRIGLQMQGLENAATRQQTMAAIAQQRADQEGERYRNLYDVATESNRAKDERTKLYAERTAATLADKEEQIKRERQKNFQAEAGTQPGGLGLPADAFENDKIQTGDTNSPGWHTDPRKPNYRYYNKPLSDNTGQPIIDPATKKQKLHPITVHEDTFKRLKNTYEDLRSGGPTSRQVTAPPPGSTWVRDPDTGKLVPQ